MNETSADIHAAATTSTSRTVTDDAILGAADAFITEPPQDVVLLEGEEVTVKVLDEANHNPVNADAVDEEIMEGATLLEQKPAVHEEAGANADADADDTNTNTEGVSNSNDGHGHPPNCDDCDDVEMKGPAFVGVLVPPTCAEGGVSININGSNSCNGHCDEAQGEKRKAGEMEAAPVVLAAVPPDVAADALAKKKRLCRYPGCTKVIKSQGHCQRHGAKAKRCKVESCEKQAQGTHDGMCKRHWKATNFPDEITNKGVTPPEPEGESVYDSILPMSIAYRPVQLKAIVPVSVEDASKHDLLDPPAAPPGFQTMPLVAHLKEGTIAGKPAGWHRNAERRARGMFPVKGLSVQLEPWERQLAMIEIMLLSGGTPHANHAELAVAWGREKGFHHVLANSVCERRGEVERKKRSDLGKAMTQNEKLTFKEKLAKTRSKNGTSKKARSLGEEEGGEGAIDLNDANDTAEDNNVSKIESESDANRIADEEEQQNEEQEKAPVNPDAAAAAGEEKATSTVEEEEKSSAKIASVFV